MQLLFSYGTLGPENQENAQFEGWRPDAVRGRLYDLGPYPALVDPDDPNAGWVEGFVRSVTTDQLSGSLDSYEGVGDGLYHRIKTRTREGREVWVYVYARPVPAFAVGPMPRWNGTKRVRLLGPPRHAVGEF
jgi:gamma-glutamylcyclotransferase (GGCT)/AIG2-like uncharacterized protein YtfP